MTSREPRLPPPAPDASEDEIWLRTAAFAIRKVRRQMPESMRPSLDYAQAALTALAPLRQAERERLDAQAAEIARLKVALEPFAKVAESEVVADALSFRGRSLMLTLGFGVVAIKASAFADARAALAPAPAAEVAG